MTTMHQHQQELARLEQRNRLLGEMYRHIGEHRAIGMAELYQIVFEEAWENRINDTRKLRSLITELRHEGTPICSVSTANGGGYYLGQTVEELNNYLRRREHRALNILSLNAKLKRITLPDYMGQLSLNMRG
ncbi:MAG: hypothetical protein JW884_14145 [Deltaproteobacteria bacterium]|nr:hypothetical protein [Deltaproteobacteria bacterium]